MPRKLNPVAYIWRGELSVRLLARDRARRVLPHWWQAQKGRLKSSVAHL